MSRFNFHDYLLRRDHTLHGGILFGIDGHGIELQGRATKVLNSPRPVADCVQVTGMTRGPVVEAVTRINGAFSKLGIPSSPVEILINLAPAALEKNGAWLDLPLAVLMLQVAGLLPDLSEDQENNFLLFGEIGTQQLPNLKQASADNPCIRTSTKWPQRIFITWCSIMLLWMTNFVFSLPIRSLATIRLRGAIQI